MKRTPTTLMILASVACFVFAAFALFREESAVGQSPTPRYQIDSYAAPVQGTGAEFGCYIIDTTTGDVWHSQKGGKAVKLAGKLHE